jgi:hypothetical protein
VGPEWGYDLSGQYFGELVSLNNNVYGPYPVAEDAATEPGSLVEAAANCHRPHPELTPPSSAPSLTQSTPLSSEVLLSSITAP